MLKLFYVFIISICNIYGYSKKYCEICPNHTLCRYEISGPSSTCLGYDKKALLTENDIKAIVDQINHRRNFIALGHSNVLPGAANMQKISWSEELATSAQRWVDQCDQTLRSEKEDQCRDLENIKVGQNVATIFGPTPGLNVKSFVEMWFMQSLKYPGVVTYYNESRDYKSNQFTQLIWATTEIVGCGKAKFYVNSNKKTIAERLVCNFAPQGNVHGKPVYIIGYPATQCLDDMYPDTVFSGLCSRPVHTNEVFGNKRSNLGRSLPVTPIANSLLRIRNLFNDSAKQEIDPVYNNLKHMKKPCKNESPPSNKKLSSIIVQDNTLDAVKRSHTIDSENFWVNHRNTSRNYGDDFYQQNKGHSRVYHGHDQRKEFDSIHPETLFTDARRFDYTTPPLNYHKDRDYRKHNINRQCTRNLGSKIIKNVATECNPCKQKIKCTRGQKINPQSHVCEDCEAPAYPQDFCRCHNFQITCPTTNPCIPNTNSQCFNFNYPVKQCPNMLRTLGTKVNNNMEKQEEIHYFDLFSNGELRKYDPTMKQEVKLFTNENVNILDKQKQKLFNKRKDNYPNYRQ
ncbi:uncharacterized protein LOC124532540 [Vanessa cardui]|uniref:uncharacterized protein LOC124532540 n=1 Tax=Vanessa cardui TaxID=171605 RepID=UPI001F147543|nr:uncharacterized protein LOC124532540 [Vanessa cardui]